mmetsp:Transcript_92904/g.259644  ORF Transcript_92904/g.259644 Transcript_92904/m.259644 type:complete len:233 (-) Transcript_92904:324-1022(-)
MQARQRDADAEGWALYRQPQRRGAGPEETILQQCGQGGLDPGEVRHHPVPCQRNDCQEASEAAAHRAEGAARVGGQGGGAEAVGGRPQAQAGGRAPHAPEDIRGLQRLVSGARGLASQRGHPYLEVRLRRGLPAGGAARAPPQGDEVVANHRQVEDPGPLAESRREDQEEVRDDGEPQGVGAERRRDHHGSHAVHHTGQGVDGSLQRVAVAIAHRRRASRRLVACQVDGQGV